MLELANKIRQYDPNSRNVLREGTLENIKTFMDHNNVNDINLLPNHLPIFGVLLSWLQRALIAKENSIIYFKEAMDEDLEIVQI